METLTVKSATKRFGSLVALNGISAEFSPGEIHAVLGENGAGKSTLMNLLAGFLTADAGEIRLGSTPIPQGDPIACRKLGIEMIHQHFMLVPAFTVEENLALNRLPNLHSSLRISDLIQTSLTAAKGLDWEVAKAARARDLPVGAQQKLEILKALGGDARVLIFDEPTAVLSPPEVTELFTVLRRLRDAGAIVILIAHKLSEVFAVADRVTVLRRGEFIGISPITDITSEQLARWMVGEFPPAQEIPAQELGPPVVEANRISVLGDQGQLAIRDVSFQIRSGEIVGFGGVEGNGQDELSEALAGLRPAGGSLTLPAHRHRIGYIPQDRQADGLALGLSIEENLLIKGVDRPELVRRGWLQLRAIRRWAAALVEKFAVKTESPRSLAGSLSGGNQQKVVVARELDAKPELLVVVNPTRGLDIRSTQFVHDSIRQAATAGTAVALFSTDLDELRALASSTYFLSRGELLTGNSAETYLGAKA